LIKGVLMNKYEKLIEYIINDNEQKARELFHEIVVEKSRDIYESLMDEEQVEENFGAGDPAANMINNVSDQTDEVGLGEEDEEGEEFSLGDEEGAEGGDELGGELGGDELGGDEFGGEEGGEGDLKSELEEIKDKIDQLLADVGGSDLDGEEGGDFGGDEETFGDESGEEGGEGGDEFGSEEEPEAFAEAKGSGKSGSGASGSGKSGSGVMEGEQPEWLKKKGSGKSGSGSGKSGSGKSGSGKSGSGVAESKSIAQMMREYVDRIGEVYGGEGDNAEGTEAGNGKKVPVNSKSISKTDGPDFGGTSKNIARGGNEQAPDGKPTPKPSNEYTKGETKFSNEKFKNAPGANAGKTSFKTKESGHGAEKKGGAEGQTTSGKVSVATKSVQTQNTGKKI
jgi:hypothetical protein